MRADRLSVTMELDLGRAVREAAARSGTSVSSWLAAAAGDRLRNELLGAALDAWQEEDGALTDSELASAAKLLGKDRPARP